LLGQALIILGTVWLAVRLLGFPRDWWCWPPFAVWRLPFYLVWVLILGIGLALIKVPYVSTGGLNLALLTGLVISVQGVAVQAHVVSRVLPVSGRLVFWTVMGVFFLPLLLASGLVLGLADQWLDLRRLSEVDLDESSEPKQREDD
jgi:hypothetical protein